MAEVAPTDDFPTEAWHAYSAWVRAGDRSTKSVLALVKAAHAAGVAAGRTRAAADIRDYRGPDPSPASPVWWAGFREAQTYYARIAEGVSDE